MPCDLMVLMVLRFVMLLCINVGVIVAGVQGGQLYLDWVSERAQDAWHIPGDVCEDVRLNMEVCEPHFYRGHTDANPGNTRDSPSSLIHCQ